MATIKATTPITPTKISQFLGLNLSDTGDTQIKLGESGNMDNFYITNDYKLRKMYGYQTFYNFPNEIKGIFPTKIGSTGYLLVATNGKLYYFLQNDLEDSEKVNPNKSKRLYGDGSTTDFSLSQTNIETIDKVTIDEIETSNYTSNLTTGTIMFNVAPNDGAEIIVEFTKHIQPTEIGTILNNDCSFFEFDNKIYILCGGYYKWDGTTLSEVQGYIPKVFISASPSGGGQLYDELNGRNRHDR